MAGYEFKSVNFGERETRRAKTFSEPNLGHKNKLSATGDNPFSKFLRSWLARLHSYSLSALFFPVREIS